MAQMNLSTETKQTHGLGKQTYCCPGEGGEGEEVGFLGVWV